MSIEVTTIACVGAGNVGRAWAIVFARAGHRVRLYDTAGDALDRARDMLAASVASTDTSHGNYSVEAVLERISYTTKIEDALAEAAHVQESAPEQLALKRRLFAQLDTLCPADVTLASSTSELMPSLFLDVARHPERCLVAHPVNPPHLIPLVELCPAPGTAAGTLAGVEQLLTSCGMSCISLQKEVSGFLLNRLQAAILGEAFSLIGQGYCTAKDIDQVMTEGLARRWAFIGPLTTGHLNASGGYREFMDALGPTWQKLIDSMRDDVRLSPELLESVINDMEQSIPVAEIGRAQLWRDGRIGALNRHLGEQAALGGDDDLKCVVASC